MSAIEDTTRPDRILIIRRGDLRVVIPLLDAITGEDGRRTEVDPTPLGILASALPTIIGYADNAPPGADTGPPLDDDASVLMLRVVGDTDPLVPDVGLLTQTTGKWQAGDADGNGRISATARVPELEVELVDVVREAIILRGANLDLTVVQDQPAEGPSAEPGEPATMAPPAWPVYAEPTDENAA